MLALIAFAVVAVGCGGRDGGEEAGQPAPRVHVRTAVVVRGVLADTIDATGEVEPLTTTRVASPVAGRVTFLSRRPGDAVAAGEVLARVIPLEAEAAMQGLALLSASGAADASMARKVGVAADVPVRAPFAGVIADRQRNPGEQVAAGDVLVEELDPHAVAVRADVPLSQRRRVRPGMAVDVQGAGVAQRGRVSALLPAMAQPASTAPVRIAFTGPAEALPVHAPVRCRIVVGRRRHALVVPRVALVSRTSERQGVVMRAVAGVARRRRVVVGLRDDDVVEVRAGLRPGDRVVTDGAWGLPDGAAIVPGDDAP